MCEPSDSLKKKKKKRKNDNVSVAEYIMTEGEHIKDHAMAECRKVWYKLLPKPNHKPQFQTKSPSLGEKMVL